MSELDFRVVAICCFQFIHLQLLRIFDKVCSSPVIQGHHPPSPRASEGLRPERNLDRRRSVLRSFSEVGLPEKGRIAQLEEHFVYIEGVRGSSPLPTTTFR